MTTTKKAPAKKAPVKKSAVAIKNKAAAFVNWAFSFNNAAGKPIQVRSNRGFTIFDTGDYTDAKEMWLVEQARKNGGVLELKATLTIRLNEESNGEAVIDDICFS